MGCSPDQLWDRVGPLCWPDQRTVRATRTLAWKRGDFLLFIKVEEPKDCSKLAIDKARISSFSHVLINTCLGQFNLTDPRAILCHTYWEGLKSATNYSNASF